MDALLSGAQRRVVMHPRRALIIEETSRDEHKSRWYSCLAGVAEWFEDVAVGADRRRLLSLLGRAHKHATKCTNVKKALGLSSTFSSATPRKREAATL